MSRGYWKFWSIKKERWIQFILFIFCKFCKK